VLQTAQDVMRIVSQLKRGQNSNLYKIQRNSTETYIVLTTGTQIAISLTRTVKVLNKIYILVAEIQKFKT